MWQFIAGVTLAVALASTSFLYAPQGWLVDVQQPAKLDDGPLWEAAPRDLQ